MSVCIANLCRLMGQHGLSIDRLADQSGLNQTAIRAVLSGSIRPDVSTLRRLAAGLGASPADLLADPREARRPARGEVENLARVPRQRVPLLDARQAVLKCPGGTASCEAVAHCRQRFPVGEICGLVRRRPELFSGWTEFDFQELRERLDRSDGMQRESILDRVRAANQLRDLRRKLALLLDTEKSQLIGGIIELVFRQEFADVG